MNINVASEQLKLMAVELKHAISGVEINLELIGDYMETIAQIELTQLGVLMVIAIICLAIVIKK